MGSPSGGAAPPDMEDALSALEAARIGTWCWAAESGLMQLSPIARQLLEDPAETGDLAAFLDCFHAEHRPALTAALRNTATQDDAFELECRLRPGRHAETWLRIKGRGRQGHGPGQAEAVRGILMTGGPRHAAERANHRLAAIVTSSDNAIVGKTVDGIITDWNPSAEVIFGYAADEVIGKSVAILAAPDREADMPTILASGSTITRPGGAARTEPSSTYRSLSRRSSTRRARSSACRKSRETSRRSNAARGRSPNGRPSLPRCWKPCPRR
jgi:two-component system sensor kinase FixL